MPPKAKFTKEEILEAALGIVRRSGIEYLTARSLGEALGSSARPIFTVFDSMDGVRQGVVALANAVYSEYVESGLKEENAFKAVGMAYIRFAGEEPKLFQLLFMSEREEIPNIKTVLPIIEKNYDKIFDSIAVHGLSRELSERLYLHLWIYTHGIAVLQATKTCGFSEKEISVMLTEVCSSIIMKAKIKGEL